MSAPSQSSTWQKLTEYRNAMQGVHLRTLFEDDAQRFDKFLLQMDVPQFIERMFRGELEDSSNVSTDDSSTNALINYYKRLRAEGSK